MHPPSVLGPCSPLTTQVNPARRERLDGALWALEPFSGGTIRKGAPSRGRHSITAQSSGPGCLSPSQGHLVTSGHTGAHRSRCWGGVTLGAPSGQRPGMPLKPLVHRTAPTTKRDSAHKVSSTEREQLWSTEIKLDNVER